MIIEVEDPEEFVAHYGVKGMRWGQRKSKAQISADKARRKKNWREGGKGHKAKVAAGGVGSYLVVGNLLSTATGNIVLGAVAGGATGIAVGRALNRKGSKEVKDA